MKGKVAVVTGGGQGIGRAIAEAFVRAGAAVVIAEIDEPAGRKAQRQFSRRGRAVFVPCDVADDKSVRGCVCAAVAEFGRLDFVINNAGIGVGKPVERLKPEEWNRVLGTNLTSIYLFARHGARHLRRARGAIVNIASTRAFMSEPNTEAYSASKGGVVSLTHSLAISLGPKVRVNCISPGWIDVSDWKIVPRKSDVPQGGPGLSPGRSGGASRGHRRDGAVPVLAAGGVHYRDQRDDRRRRDEEDDLPVATAASATASA